MAVSEFDQAGPGTRGRRSRCLPALLLALLQVGCGLSDPYDAATTSRAATRPAAQTIGPGEHDGPTPELARNLAARAGQATPAAALSGYGWRYVNWSWQTVSADERRLAAVSVGQAHAQALAAAARPQPTLARYAVHNQGEVVAIARGQGTERGKWAVITNEHTSGDGPYQGLPATSHVTWATVQHDGQRWLVSGWYPGN